MSTHQCLNCGQEVSLNYCSNCGQKTATHRFSVKHVITHDIVHGIFHLDKGFLYTAREVLLRPGRSIRDYVDGKRVSHFNAFTFIVLLAALYHLLYTSTGFRISEVFRPLQRDPEADRVQAFFIDNYKFIVFLMVPFYALFTALVFRKARQNFAEHVVLNVYKQAGELLVTTIAFAVFLPFRNTTIAPYVFVLTNLMTGAYSIWFYYQYFRRDYKHGYWLFQRALLVQMMAGFVMGTLSFLMVHGYLARW